MKYVRRVLSDQNMIILGLAILAVALFLFAENTNVYLLYAIAFSLPFGMGSLQPSLMSLLGQHA